MTRLWSAKLADDPEAFVLFVFPWGQPNTPLAKFKGPRTWQRNILRDIKGHIERNQGQIGDFAQCGGLRARYWQVGVGVVAHFMDADDADWLDGDRQRQQ